MSPFKDKKQQSAYQVEWARKQRSKKKEAATDQSASDTSGENSNPGVLNPVLKPPLEVRLRSAENCLEVLERAMGEVLASDAEVIVRCRAVGFLIEKASKLIEITDLATKVERLQKIVDSGEGAKSWKESSY